MLLLVRHALAIPRAEWDGADARRPLTRRGQRQAAGLPDVLAGYDVDRVLSSPAERCRATVGSFSDKRGMRVKASKALGEGRGGDALDLAVDAVEDLVLCTHGDVVLAVLRGLRHLGWPVPERPRHAKGSSWVLTPGCCEYLAPPA
jgi:phosphohistidine phosphatase SixA